MTGVNSRGSAARSSALSIDFVCLCYSVCLLVRATVVAYDEGVCCNVLDCNLLVATDVDKLLVGLLLDNEELCCGALDAKLLVVLSMRMRWTQTLLSSG